MDLRDAIRTIPDHPKPGILFRDITTLLGHAQAFRQAVDELADPWRGDGRDRGRGGGIDKVAGIEARGFILGGAIAHVLGLGFVPLRKKGKLPHRTLVASYTLEYGVDELHMHEDAVVAGERVLLVDDLIATGGTAEAGIDLLRRGGGEVAGAAFIVDLPDLGGAARIEALGVPVRALLAYAGH